MKVERYLDIKHTVMEAGHTDDIDWCEDVKPCSCAVDFFLEYLWVVCNSGMKYEIAQIIYKKILTAIIGHRDVSEVFNHAGKCKSITFVKDNKESLFKQYGEASDKIAFLSTLPHIGPITKYHLARNLGLDVCKPDRHLERIAGMYDTTPHALCDRLAQITGDRVGTVDIVLWWAGKMGLVTLTQA